MNATIPSLTSERWYSLPHGYEMNDRYEVRNRLGLILKQHTPTGYILAGRSYSLNRLAEYAGLPIPRKNRTPRVPVQLRLGRSIVAYWFPSQASAARFIGSHPQNVRQNAKSVYGWRRV
jgi:hypothetical protein